MNEPWCSHHPSGHSDDAKRVSDGTKLAWVVYQHDLIGKWMSFSLEDGSSSNEVYPSKIDAIRFAPSNVAHMFIVMHPYGMSVCEAQIMLSVHRNARHGRIAMPDIDLKNGGPDLIPRIGHREVRNQILALRGYN